MQYLTVKVTISHPSLIPYHHHPPYIALSYLLSTRSPPRSDMASLVSLWFLALLSSFPFSPLSFLHLFFLPLPLPLPPTSVSPCGGLLKVSPFSLLLFCSILVFALVRSLLILSSSGFLHDLHLSRRAARKHVFARGHNVPPSWLNFLQ